MSDMLSVGIVRCWLCNKESLWQYDLPGEWYWDAKCSCGMPLKHGFMGHSKEPAARWARERLYEEALDD